MIALLMIAHDQSVTLFQGFLITGILDSQNTLAGDWHVLPGVCWNDVGNLRAVGTCYAGVIVERCGTWRVTGTC